MKRRHGELTGFFDPNNPNKNHYLRLVRSDDRITIEDLKLLFEKDLEHISSLWIFAVGALVGLLTYALGNITALGPNALSTYQGVIATLVSLTTFAGITLFLYVINWLRASRIEFRYFIEAEAELESAKGRATIAGNGSITFEEKNTENNGTVKLETPPNESVETKREKLRFYWDYERSNFTQMLAIIFSALVGAATILNVQVASPITRLNVFYEDAAMIIVFAYLTIRLVRVILRFKIAVVKTNGYLTSIDSADKPLSNLLELCGITQDPSVELDEWNRFWKWKGPIMVAIIVIILIYLALSH